MPRGFDTVAPTADFDPLANKLNFAMPDFAGELEKAAAQAAELFFTFTVQAIDQVTGIDLSILLPEIKLVTSLFSGTPQSSGDLVTTFVGAFDSVLGINLSTLLPELQLLQTGLPGIFAGFLSTSTDLPNLVSGFLNTFALPAFNLFGTPPVNFFDIIPLSSIGQVSPNILANPIFSDADSITGAPDWTWDGTVTHSSTGGSATVHADGGLHELYSNALGVVVAQHITASIWAQWSGLAWTGTPIKLNITSQYNPGTGASVTVIETITLQAISPSGASSGFVQLTGTYTVPAAVGANPAANEVLISLEVNTTATAGQVWFSDGSLTKSVVNDVVPQAWISGLPTSLGDLNSLVSTAANNIQTTWDTVFNGFTGLFNTGHTTTDLSSSVTGVANTQAGLASSVSQIKSALGAGNPDSDEFERSGAL